jgi:hypothetical protein
MWFSSLLTWGGVAAVLQVTGYLIYLRYFVKHSIRPNAASWFMFAYGTLFLTYLEYRGGAAPTILWLPLSCAAMSIFVALLCLRRNATEPVDRFEKIIFSADLWLTVIYGCVTLGFGASILSSQFTTLILIAVNLTAVTCFLPIVRSTWQKPDRERPAPWGVWALAYGCLTAATLQIDGLTNPVMLLYPVLNFILHGLIAIFALRSGSAERVFMDSARTVYLAQSNIHGRGAFAGQGFSKGDVVWTMSGRPVFHSNTDAEPNFVGIAPGFWINPDAPIDTMNHSCAPNAAFDRNFELVALDVIHAHDEIVFDYSTTEADPDWQMACACAAPGCRKTLHAIQFAFPDSHFPPAASPAMQQVWHAHRRGSLGRSAFPQFGAAKGLGNHEDQVLEFPNPVASEVGR